MQFFLQPFLLLKKPYVLPQKKQYVAREYPGSSGRGEIEKNGHHTPTLPLKLYVHHRHDCYASTFSIYTSHFFGGVKGSRFCATLPPTHSLQQQQQQHLYKHPRVQTNLMTAFHPPGADKYLFAVGENLHNPPPTQGPSSY